MIWYVNDISSNIFKFFNEMMTYYYNKLLGTDLILKLISSNTVEPPNLIHDINSSYSVTSGLGII